MYSFEEFVTQVKYGLESVLRNRYGGADISVVTNRKVNCERVGLVCNILNEQRISPTIYMESLYNVYLERGDIDECIARATEALTEAMQECSNLRKKIDCFADAKDKIIFQLVHTEQNKELLKTMPHREFMDMSIIYRCVFDISDGGMLSAPISHSYAGMLGLNEEELYQLAYENTRYIMKPTVRTMEQVIEGLEEALCMKREIMGEETMEQRPPLYVITNSQKTWGAASVLYKEKLLSLAEKLESDLYLIPSSVHEMIITKAEQDMLEVVESTLYEVNQSISIEDRLSNEIYLYDRKNNSITQVTDSAHKMLNDELAEAEQNDAGMQMGM